MTASTRQASAKQQWDIGASAELSEGARLVADAGQITVGVFRIDGNLYAWESTCPHMEGPVCQGLMVPAVREVLDDKGAIKGSVFDASDMRICCPWHGMEFSIKTGQHPANANLRLRKVAVSEAGGRILVEA
jgi:nitrite reductase/ring-hydroxylating ferredoxin subunit